MTCRTLLLSCGVATAVACVALASSVVANREAMTTDAPLVLSQSHPFERSHSSSSSSSSLSSSPWKLVWSDEFDGTQLNLSAWNVRTNETHCCGPFGGTGELELYVPDEVSVEDGSLVLRTRHREPAVRGPRGVMFNFTSGWVDTSDKVAFKYGRFEVGAWRDCSNHSNCPAQPCMHACEALLQLMSVHVLV
jgi:beta-glucanase (GH16 family)